MTKRITWIDLVGRYRITTPAYNDTTRPAGETEEALLERVWARLVEVGLHGIPIDHPHNIVEVEAIRLRTQECCGNLFRYGVFMKPNREGTLDPSGKVELCRDARDGAWEMGDDGLPIVNLAKARGVQMDCIRQSRNSELEKLDVPFIRAVEAGDASEQSRLTTEKQALRDIPQTFDLTTDTPIQLRDKWPDGLPHG